MNENVPGTIDVHPQDCARWTSEFLESSKLAGCDHGRFGICKAFLQAIIQGRVLVVPAPTAAPAAAECTEPVELTCHG